VRTFKAVVTSAILAVTIAVIGLGLKTIIIASPDADAEPLVRSPGLSPEQIFRDHPNKNNLPISEGNNAI
jgi:hypothetical protein